MNEIGNEIESGLENEEGGPQLTKNVLVDDGSQWDTEQFIDQLWRELGGVTSHSHIRRVLIEIAPTYDNVRVKTFVPILLRRDVLQRLQDDLELSQGTKVP